MWNEILRLKLIKISTVCQECFLQFSSKVLCILQFETYVHIRWTKTFFQELDFCLSLASTRCRTSFYISLFEIFGLAFVVLYGLCPRFCSERRTFGIICSSRKGSAVFSPIVRWELRVLFTVSRKSIGHMIGLWHGLKVPLLMLLLQYATGIRVRNYRIL